MKINDHHPLILVHGLGQEASSWNPTISFLDHQQNIFCPELSSFLKQAPYTYEILYQHFSAYCNPISTPFHLCGLSLGAVLALHYALDHPENVQSLILIAPQFQMPKGLLRFQNILFRFMPQTAFASTGFSKKAFMDLTHSMMSLNFTDALKSILCPVLVICGEKDNTNKKAARQLADSMINARLEVIPDAGHEVNLEQPEKLASAIYHFNSQCGNDIFHSL